MKSTLQAEEHTPGCDNKNRSSDVRAHVSLLSEHILSCFWNMSLAEGCKTSSVNIWCAQGSTFKPILAFLCWVQYTSSDLIVDFLLESLMFISPFPSSKLYPGPLLTFQCEALGICFRSLSSQYVSWFLMQNCLSSSLGVSQQQVFTEHHKKFW